MLELNISLNLPDNSSNRLAQQDLATNDEFICSKPRFSESLQDDIKNKSNIYVESRKIESETKCNVIIESDYEIKPKESCSLNMSNDDMNVDIDELDEKENSNIINLNTIVSFTEYLSTKLDSLNSSEIKELKLMQSQLMNLKEKISGESIIEKDIINSIKEILGEDNSKSLLDLISKVQQINQNGYTVKQHSSHEEAIDEIVEEIKIDLSKNANESIINELSSIGHATLLKNEFTRNVGITSNMDSIKESNLKTDDMINLLNSKQPSFISRESVTISNADNAQIIRQDFLFDDINSVIHRMSSNNLKELKLRLKPRELGEILITISKKNGSTNISFAVSNEDSFKLIQSNIKGIEAHLKQVNLISGDSKIEAFIQGSEDKNNRNSNLEMNFSNQGKHNSQKFNNKPKTKSKGDYSLDEGVVDSSALNTKAENSSSSINILA